MRTEIIIPTRAKSGTKLPPQLVRFWTQKTVALVNSLLGGSTRYSGWGSWTDEQGTTHNERVIVVWAWGTPTDEQALEDHCRDMAAALDQLAVAYSTGSPNFVGAAQ